jgi:hypothetical protein
MSQVKRWFFSMNTKVVNKDPTTQRESFTEGMAEKEYLNNENEADIERSSEGIRRDIAEQK